MKQDVIISIMVKQDYEDQEEELMELVTRGVMEEHKGAFRISYEETEMTGLGGTTTTFLVDDDRIVLTREGTVRSYMQFEEGRRHNSIYDTPYGTMDVEVHTTAFAQNIGKTGGEITLDYNIEISKTIVGNNFFQIKVALPKEKKPLS